MADISPDDLKNLAAKLDGLDLNDTERALLDELFERAASYEPEVEGFGFDASGVGSYTGNHSGAGLSGTSLQLGGGLGFVTRPSLGYDDPFDPTRGGGGGPGKPPPP